jgi:flagellar P-ring protein precursor FlgI
MLERLGVNTRGTTLRTANVAAVMVTANLPAFSTQGTRLDVTVSALGDAKSLQGGTLLVTPLLGADGEVYAVAQGSVAIAGFQAEGDAAKITRGVPTVGRISNGALIEREVEFKLNAQKALRLALRNPDLTTAKRIAAAINDFLGADTAEPTDPSTVHIQIPAKYRGNMIQLLTEVEQLRVEPDQTAKIVIDERSGIIVMGKDVRVSTVAVAQGNLTVTISEQPQVSQPNPLSNGETRVVPRTGVKVDTGDANKLAVVREGVTLRELVDGLNALGKEFETMFLEQTLERVFASSGTEGPLGDNGTGGAVYRSMLVKEYAGGIAKSGGVGIASQIYRELLKLQEAAHAGSA